VQLDHPMLNLLSRGRGSWRKKRSDCAHLFVHEHDAVVKRVGEIETLNLFEAFCVSVVGQSPSRPRVGVERCGEDQRCGVQVRRSGGTYAVAHAVILPWCQQQRWQASDMRLQVGGFHRRGTRNASDAEPICLPQWGTAYGARSLRLPKDACAPVLARKRFPIRTRPNASEPAIGPGEHRFRRWTSGGCAEEHRSAVSLARLGCRYVLLPSRSTARPHRVGRG